MSSPARLPQEITPLFAALELSPDPVFVTDRHNRIAFWNASAERLLGFTAEEVVGGPCAGVLRGCDAFGNRYCSESCPVTQMAARSESVRNFGLRLVARDGSEVMVDVSILMFTVPPPERFFLAHVLQPSERHDRRVSGDEPAVPPRSALVAVKESPDVRARKLTPREVEVLGMIAAGVPTPEIASRLHLSVLTARNHVQNILDKLEVHSKAEAVAFAFQKRIL